MIDPRSRSLKVCLHKRWFSVSDATAASNTAQKNRIDPIFCAVLDAAVGCGCHIRHWKSRSCKHPFSNVLTCSYVHS
jgi:hypothetical protein